MKTVNRKAYYDYHINDEFVAGIQLLGSEVKSLRKNNCTLTDGFCYIKDNEIFLKNISIKRYEESSYYNHDENRDRKLLLHKSEIKKISKELVKGTTLIPLELFLLNGKFKVKIALAKGKKNYDKRETIKKRDVERSLN